MKKVYVEINNGLPINVDIQNAIDGFEYLCYDIHTFTKQDVVSGKYINNYNKYPFIGSIDSITKIFKSINKYPEPIDFPNSIIEKDLLGRSIIKMNLNDFITEFKTNKIPKFVKPVKTKLFDGIVISKEEQLSYLYKHDNCDVYVSDVIGILSEYRIFVHNKKAIYSSNYSGNFKISPDYKYVDKLIEEYDEQPLSYTIDIGILSDLSNTVIEFNDFWSIGSYGLNCIEYANLLKDRYFQIVC